MNKVFIKCGQQHICKEYTKKLRKIGEEKKKNGEMMASNIPGAMEA